MEENRNNVERKKNYLLLKLIFLLLSLVLVAWIILSWYFGSKTESQFRQFILAKSEVIGDEFFHVEFINYKSTLLGGRASVRLSSDISNINKFIGEVTIDASFYNGPIFYTKKGIKVGSSFWRLEIEKDQLSESQLQAIHIVFPNNLPVLFVHTDFEQKAHYYTRLSTNIAEAGVTGVYSFETDKQQELNRGSISLENFNLETSDISFEAEKATISYQHQSPLSANYKPGTTSLSIPELRINQKTVLPNSAYLKVEARSDFSMTENLVSGFLTLDLSQLPEKTDLPFESAKLALSFSNLSQAGVLEASDTKGVLDNLEQQIDWTVEDLGAYPEGRDEILILHDQINSAVIKLNRVITEEIFQNQDAKLDINAKSEHGELSSSLRVLLAGAQLENGLDKQKVFTEGNVKVELDDEMFRFVKNVFKAYESLEEIEFNKQFELKIKEGKMLYHTEK